ncbi:uncharacterized protein LOC120357430 [Solenopsis invicta]|uniref:uncharacterized protein LOC120357430 n=1 Tax=Solenopsis invicta TaxID=13686 RepID=UPI00193DBD4C|nr:uncharacterized protein LOC120357430 [Solenopsis invicta]
MSRIMQNNTNSIMDKRNVTSANTKRELLQNRLSNRSSETHRIELEVPRSKWNILSEVINCQLGRNLLPQRRFFGSLQGVRQLELKYNLTDNEMYEVRSLNFNKKGNLLVNTSYNKILIWNWTARERALLTCVKGGEAEYIFRIKWFDTNSLVLSNFRGEIFLVHVKRNVLERLTMFNVRSRFTVVHDETPHVILCATRRAKVFSIDIRQKEIHK